MRYLQGADPATLAQGVAVPVLFLDIDGTVRQGKDELGRFVHDPADVVVFPDAVDEMAAWKQRGGRIVGVSNQGGIAQGYVTAQAVEAAMRETQRQTGNRFDLIVWCQHHPSIQFNSCWCRKPKPGMLLRAVWELAADHPGEWYPSGAALMVGDRPEDADCARAAGIRFQWASAWRAGDDETAPRQSSPGWVR